MSSNNDSETDNAAVHRKQQLRKEVRARLKALTKEEIKTQSQKVWDCLFTLPAYQQAQSIGLFLSMPTNEIDTGPVLRDAVSSGKVIYVPQVGKNFQQADMDLIKVVGTTSSSSNNEQQQTTSDNDNGKLFYHSWPRNKWGIPEPPPDMPMHAAVPGDIDLLVVPGLAFDQRGDRLGQGKGYYDRFIERMMMVSDDDDDNNNNNKAPPPVLIAVGLDCQLVDSVPVREHDRRMDMVLLPSQKIDPSSQAAP